MATRKGLLVYFFVAVVLAGGVSALLVDIFSKKEEARQYPLMLAKLSDQNVDPEVWGRNFPAEYDGYKKMEASSEYTTFGGSLPYSKLIRYPQLVRLWAGYPFAADFNEERSHYYAQIDQLDTKRNNKEWLNAHGFPKFSGQPGACMNCHSGWAPGLVRELGWGAFNKTPYTELALRLLQAHGDGPHGAKLGGTCADCHSPEDMTLRVTRPAYIEAMLRRGYQMDPKTGIRATRQEMRSHVCQQCHVEYYFQKGTAELIFPWAMWPKGEPLRIEMVEQHYDVFRTDKDKFQQDWFHRETGAPMLKMQHPETELYSSGIHARSGVACADCHMPYQREGAVKVSNHWIRSPLFDIEASCQTCHALPADKLRERVNVIQRGTARGLRMAEQAILSLVDDISRARRVIEATSTYDKFFSLEEKEAYVSKILDPAREYHRRASMRWDFVFSENSMGFHGPQEAMRALAQAVDLARRGQLTLVNSLARAGLSLSPLTPIGQIPAPPEPITERKPPVGDPPPLPLTDFDKLLDKL